MPTNLNALIRYKQIDACLKNPYVPCTIASLQEACTSALSEFRGIYKLVSERTIRDDIRVMRSNMLGFNAPIAFDDGKYFYTDKNYSIFKTPVTEVDLLRDIMKMLIEERNNITDSEIDNLLKRIAVIVGAPIPFEMEQEFVEDDLQETRFTNHIKATLQLPKEEKSAFSPKPLQKQKSFKFRKTKPIIKPLLLWEAIFGVV